MHIQKIKIPSLQNQPLCERTRTQSTTPTGHRLQWRRRNYAKMKLTTLPCRTKNSS